MLTLGVNGWGPAGVPALLDTLTAAGGAHRWDVRDLTTTGPWSAAWAGKNLQAACEAAGVIYVRRRELGVPKAERGVLLSLPPSERLARYAGLLYGRGVDLGEVLADVLAHPGPAFLCWCRSDGSPCHRFLLAELLGLGVVNLTPGPLRGVLEVPEHDR